jgi:N-acetylmuramoyl-L-alanine amidase
VQAADLRERMWRLEGREADGLEALELLAQAGMGDPKRRCEVELRQALLQGELSHDPSQLYEAVYLVQESYRDDSSCTAKASELLDGLTSFKSAPDVLAGLKRKAGERRGDSGASAAEAPKLQVVTPAISPSAVARDVRITNVEHYASKDAARVVIFVTSPALFQVGRLAAEANGQGPRLYVDIGGASFNGPSTYKLGGIAERVRLGQQNGSVRIVLDLAAPVSEQIFYLPEPFRLVVDVSRHTSNSVAEGPRGVQRVVLDPGHGGHDPGAIGGGGLREKDVVLDIAHRAAPLIARELGISTLLTRDVDTFVPLDERVARANAFGADLFISIHCNSSETTGGRGVMTFILAGETDALASRIAARENAASPAAAAELATAMSRVLDARISSASLTLAQLIQRATLASTSPYYPDVKDGGVHRAGFYVLAGARMPAVLFETSFISNPVDELRLNSGDYRQKMADALVNAVRAYRDGL